MASLAAARPQDVQAALASGRRFMTRFGIWLTDLLSRRWLARNVTPYANDISAVAALAKRPGAYALNLSYEWACTTAVVGGQLARILDWPLKGLGRLVLVCRHQPRAPLGAWYNVTWAGFVGVLTALAPGRFAAAINQAPLPKITGIFVLDWLLARLRIASASAIPAAHLLRQVFETCPDTAAALRLLCETALPQPAIFILAGADGAAYRIERPAQGPAIVTPGPCMAANHWAAASGAGWSRGYESETRGRLMQQFLRQGEALGDDFAWLQPPILNFYNRLAVVADPATGALAVMGMERQGDSAIPVTRVFRAVLPRS